MTRDDDVHASKERALNMGGCVSRFGVVERFQHTIAIGRLKNFDNAESLNGVREAIFGNGLYRFGV